MYLDNWYDLSFFSSDKYVKLTQFLTEQRNQGINIFPASNEILNALVLTPLENVKVVILGQDPYPTLGHAHGLSFSVQDHVTPLPKSLNNIFNELYSDLNIPPSKTGNLTKWAEQGVLLLNTTLTVEQGKPQSHYGLGWEVLTNEIIKTISDQREHVVFILWGRHAQKKSKYINDTKHLIIESAHPSPLSAYNGFFGSKPFSKTNQYLEHHKIKPINWVVT